MNVVIVESPAKAKTINKYLGSDYKVLASFGHVRDLPSKDGSVDPEKDFDMKWSVDSRAESTLKEITKAVKGAEKLILATDPDREGEAISWHILEELKRRKAVSETLQIERVVFNAITKTAILEAMNTPRDIATDLVDAYLARRALDYLVGFTLSPVLWRKLPGSRSAGRVQSVALRLICEREAEIEIFQPQEYWSIVTDAFGDEKKKFEARLFGLDDKKLGKFSLANEADAKKAADKIKAGKFQISKIEKKTVARHPSPPFITSTLQQEASRKLGFGASKTMRTAQKLYEGVTLSGETVGLITYMRTDSITMVGEALHDARKVIESEFGNAYLPEKPRAYKSKAKNAQEAHEAIRPTRLSRHPKTLSKFLSSDEMKLYTLIWKRAIASQMKSAALDQTTIQIHTQNKDVELRATGTMVKFDGFFKLYQEGQDDKEDDKEEQSLPSLKEGEKITIKKIDPKQHFTQPPPRYSEASLVKRLEELGIGRPSTYASILQVLQDRDYVTLDKKRFIPEDRGRLVTSFLKHFFLTYVEYDFTAELENKLDEVSDGGLSWKSVLQEFWGSFNTATKEAQKLTITEVIDKLDAALEKHFFPVTEKSPKPRKCPTCDNGRLGLKLARTGGFIGCSNYPECKHTQPLSVVGEDNGEQAFPKELGVDDNGEKIAIKKGPYGLYVQLGEGDKPKRSTIPKGMSADKMTLEDAKNLLKLPREVGEYPETGQMIHAGLGRFGPYLKIGNSFVSLKEDNVLEVGLNRSIALIHEYMEKNKPLKEFGNHPESGDPIEAKKGRYGPFLACGRKKVPLKDIDIDSLSTEDAVKMVDDYKKPTKTKAKTKAKPKTKKASS